MFGVARADFDGVTQRVVKLENTVGMVCPRVASLEHWVSAIQTRLTHVETRTDRLQKTRDPSLWIMDEPEGAQSPGQIEDPVPAIADHVDISQYTGQPTATLVLPVPSHPAPAPEGTVSLTAPLADDAPLFTEGDPDNPFRLPPLQRREQAADIPHRSCALQPLALQLAIATSVSTTQRWHHVKIQQNHTCHFL